MIIVPKEKPVMKNLNSYYLDIKKLFEHYQGEFGSGCIHFKSLGAEGVIFFDQNELLSGVFEDKEGKVNGQGALDHLVRANIEQNFNIDIYKINPHHVYFWSNVPSATEIYKDLNTEFTDLKVLVKNMHTVKFTGYIDVSINGTEEGGLIFFNNGEIMGGSYSWLDENHETEREDHKELILRTSENGATFNVRRISVTKEDEGDLKRRGRKISADVLAMLEKLLEIFENVVLAKKGLHEGFDTLLKKKFVEKADTYGFLDPFAAEFEYSDRKIRFFADSTDQDLAKGLVESVKELAEELHLFPQLRHALKPWSKRYGEKLERLGVQF